LRGFFKIPIFHKTVLGGSMNKIEVFCESEFWFTTTLFVKSLITAVSDVMAVLNYSMHVTLEAFMVWRSKSYPLKFTITLNICHYRFSV